MILLFPANSFQCSTDWKSSKSNTKMGCHVWHAHANQLQRIQLCTDPYDRSSARLLMWCEGVKQNNQSIHNIKFRLEYSFHMYNGASTLSELKTFQHFVSPTHGTITKHFYGMLVQGSFNELSFVQTLMRALVQDCLCGVKQ